MKTAMGFLTSLLLFGALALASQVRPPDIDFPIKLPFQPVEIPTKSLALVLSASSKDVRNDQRDITVNFQTAAPVTGNCDLIVGGFNYDSVGGLIDIETADAEACLDDSISNRKGHMTWQVPTSLAAISRTLSIYVNGIKLGEMKSENGVVQVVPATATALKNTLKNGDAQ